jgi:hypothetical protein
MDGLVTIFKAYLGFLLLALIFLGFMLVRLFLMLLMNPY